MFVPMIKNDQTEKKENDLIAQRGKQKCIVPHENVHFVVNTKEAGSIQQ